jgi:uncharacterized phage-associated protein
MPYFAAQIANEFIRRARTDGVDVDPLKVQKLIYLAHGWHLAFLGTPLIREGIEAWRYGPVVPSLYRQFRRFGIAPITTEATLPNASIEQIDPKSSDLISQVWKTYGKKTGLELSMLTHEPGRAWDIIRRTNANDWNSPTIPDEYIKDEFEKRKAKG